MEKKPRLYWLRKLLCKIFGHITIGRYYGMPQAHCRRCGKKSFSAGKHCPAYDYYYADQWVR